MWALVGILAAWRIFPYLFRPVYDVALTALYAGV
jgi:hypothetical protein